MADQMLDGPPSGHACPSRSKSPTARARGDRGPGVPLQLHARIFERFERVSSTTYDGGLGLGLYISRQIVEAHGGTIAVASVPGSGATFTVRLPLG